MYSIFYQISRKIRLVSFKKVLNSAFHHRRVFPPTAIKNIALFPVVNFTCMYVFNDKQIIRWYTHWTILSDTGNHCRLFHHILNVSMSTKIWTSSNDLQSDMWQYIYLGWVYTWYPADWNITAADYTRSQSHCCKHQQTAGTDRCL